MSTESFISKFSRLSDRGIVPFSELADAARCALSNNEDLGEVLVRRGVPKHEVLFCLSEHYGVPYAEFDEGLLVSYFIVLRLDFAQLRRSFWLPTSVVDDRAEVIAADPGSPALVSEIRETLRVSDVSFTVALPSDLIRLIDHNFDVNPGFPRAAGRTMLAMTRTFLADRRSLMSGTRTSLAKGRTGLAFLRTGISFITISVLLFRIFGSGIMMMLPESLLLVLGLIMSGDGLVWYIRSRGRARSVPDCSGTEPTWGSTVLQLERPGNAPVFRRTGPVADAGRLRSSWNGLSPVMRRRFLANDRTDFAEERTVLACYRTMMARARTGLAFTRTGVAFAGLGIGLLRQFPAGPWTAFDISLIAIGVLMATEGFIWYLPGRRAGKHGYASVNRSRKRKTIWDFAFPPLVGQPSEGRLSPPRVRPSHAPGIWATTGLALERTVLADRRNVMAWLRTLMARSRTGLAFVRTGMSIAAVGMGLLIYFGVSNTAWAVFNAALVAVGLVLMGDGFSWHFPAERMKRQYPYCFGEMELSMPDYGRPAWLWKRAVFSHDNDA